MKAFSEDYEGWGQFPSDLALEICMLMNKTYKDIEYCEVPLGYENEIFVQFRDTNNKAYAYTVKVTAEEETIED